MKKKSRQAANEVSVQPSVASHNQQKNNNPNCRATYMKITFHSPQLEVGWGLFDSQNQIMSKRVIIIFMEKYQVRVNGTKCLFI